MNQYNTRQAARKQTKALYECSKGKDKQLIAKYLKTAKEPVMVVLPPPAAKHISYCIRLILLRLEAVR